MPEIPIASGIATLLSPILHQPTVPIHSLINILKPPTISPHRRLHPSINDFIHRPTIPSSHPSTNHFSYRPIKHSPNPSILARGCTLAVVAETKGDKGRSRFGSRVAADKVAGRGRGRGCSVGENSNQEVSKCWQPLSKHLPICTVCRLWS